jgi:hypothetical protein
VPDGGPVKSRHPEEVDPEEIRRSRPGRRSCEEIQTQKKSTWSAQLRTEEIDLVGAAAKKST